MEKGAAIGSGFNVLGKKSLSNSDFDGSMKLQTSTEAFPLMAGAPHHLHGNYQSRPFVGDYDDAGGRGCTSGGGGLGPTHGSGVANEVVGFIDSGDFSSSVGGGGNLAHTSANLLAFDMFPSAYSAIPCRSSGMCFPFTAAQWKELERQALIYKCMISSVPVPPHLLLPLSRNFPATAPVDSSVSSIYSGRYFKNGDPEPGRCKRTDGKKWRCSREVAPHQKYCERHLNRGRSRSRKPVEAKNNAAENHKKTRLEQSKSLPTVRSTSQHPVAANEPLLLLNPKTDLNISAPYYKGTNRDLSLAPQGGIVASEQPWESLMEANMGLGNCYFPQDNVEQQPLNVFSYPNFPAPEIELPSSFIDAWSIDSLNSRSSGNMEPSLSLNEGDLSPSLNLSMTMAAGNILDREMTSIQTGNSVKYCDDRKAKDSIWTNHASWEPFVRGGPLSEALQPVGGSNPASPYNSISTPATTVSSPSGVLHWTLFSHSDSSVCNSPTFVPPPP